MYNINFTNANIKDIAVKIMITISYELRNLTGKKAGRLRRWLRSNHTEALLRFLTACFLVILFPIYQAFAGMTNANSHLKYLLKDFINL